METTGLNKSELVEFVRSNNGGADQDLVDFFLLTYIDCKDDPFPVGGEVAQQWIGFTLKSNFKRFVMNAGLVEGVDFGLLIPKDQKSLDTMGRPSQELRFTIDAFKTLCMLAKTDMGRKVRIYYLKMETLVAKFVNKEAVRQRELLMIESTEARRKAVHDALVRAYASGVKLVYFAFVEDCDDGDIIIKIGSTEGLKGRMKKHKVQFGTIFMMEIIPSGRFREFELKIRQHREVEPFYIPYVLKDGVVSNETFKVSHEKYLSIIRLAKSMEKNFLHTNRESKRMYRERLAELNLQHKIEATKVDAERAAAERINAEANLIKETSIASARAILVEAMPRTVSDLFAKVTADPRDKDVKELCMTVVGELHRLVNDKESMSEKQDVVNDDVADDNARWAPSQPPERVVTRGFAIQRYDDKGKSLIESYQSVSDAQRSFGGSVSAIKRASKKRQVYKGFRWNEVDRDADKNTAYDIGESVYVKAVDTGLVAKLNIRGDDLVLDVFKSQGDAAAAENLKNAQSIGLAIKKGSPSAGFRWKWWHQLDESVQDAYLEHHDLPEPPKKQGTRIQRIHPTTGAVEETYDSIAATVSKHRIATKALKKACDDGHVHDGWCWKMIANNE